MTFEAANTVEAMSYSDMSAVSTASNGWPARKRRRRSPIFALDTKAASGDTCLSSPTTRICLPRKIAGSAHKSDWLASSTITRSKAPSAAGRVSDTRAWLMIQHGTAAWASTMACCASRR